MAGAGAVSAAPPARAFPQVLAGAEVPAEGTQAPAERTQAPATPATRAPATRAAATRAAATPSAWTDEKTYGPTVGEGSLDAVSCAGSCMAVGGHEDADDVAQPLAETDVAPGAGTGSGTGAGTTWDSSAAIPPVGAYSAQLDAVDCTSADACTAVGSAYDAPSQTTTTLAEAWDGSSWGVESTPLPEGDASGELDGVSCTSATSCVAVGDANTEAGPPSVAPLVESWDGTTWTVDSTPTPPEVDTGYLDAVSCTPDGACTAVGYAGDAPLAESLEGASWTIDPTSEPAGADFADLEGVSCTAADACTAVGYQATGSGIQSPLAEAWDGSSWSVEDTATLPGDTEGKLASVSCVAVDSCTAVGEQSGASSGQLTLAEAWDGTEWDLQGTPAPGAPTDEGLEGVWCSAADDCTAVGAYEASGTDVTLDEGWDGTSWTVETTADPPAGAAAGLAAVSCAGPDACTAVGSSVAGMLAEVWDGTTWSDSRLPAHQDAGSAFLQGVSCTAARRCMAVGYTVKSGTQAVDQVAELQHGSTWRTLSMPAVTDSELTAVSCPAANTCVAVGYMREATLAMAWNGSTWTQQTTPDAKNATYTHLLGVSCTGADACQAVGYSYTTGTYRTVAEGWNGTSWRIEPTPTLADDDSFDHLTGLSCTSLDACEAVGYFNTAAGSSKTLAEVWDGSSWAKQPMPASSHADEYLEGVSCTAAACLAAGWYRTTSGTERTMALQLDGTSWTTVTTADPEPSVTDVLDGVSCPASATASTCDAVGARQTSGIEHPLAEQGPVGEG